MATMRSSFSSWWMGQEHELARKYYSGRNWRGIHPLVKEAFHAGEESKALALANAKTCATVDNGYRKIPMLPFAIILPKFLRRKQ
jgi:hypothetical protein